LEIDFHDFYGVVKFVSRKSEKALVYPVLSVMFTALIEPHKYKIRIKMPASAPIPTAKE
jgi:hypothetical protein